MCAILSERYINDRFLPDKAIDLLDEACACRSIRSPELAENEKLIKAIAEQENKVHEVEEQDEPDFESLLRLKQRYCG